MPRELVKRKRVAEFVLRLRLICHKYNLISVICRLRFVKIVAVEFFDTVSVFFRYADAMLDHKLGEATIDKNDLIL